jgi:hypothetical protein
VRLTWNAKDTLTLKHPVDRITMLILNLNNSYHVQEALGRGFSLSFPSFCTYCSTSRSQSCSPLPVGGPARNYRDLICARIKISIPSSSFSSPSSPSLSPFAQVPHNALRPCLPKTIKTKMVNTESPSPQLLGQNKMKSIKWLHPSQLI